MQSDQPLHSFGITTCREMLAKLDRELERVARGTFGAREIVDHSINCALTAWHMVDWIWQLHFRNDEEAQETLAQKADIDRQELRGDGSSPPQWFKDALFTLCDGLRDCQAIANGTKHVFLERTPTETIEAHVSARAASAFTLGVSKLSGGDDLANDDGKVPAATQYLPKIKRADGTTRVAIEVMDGVTRFWRQLLEEFEIP